MSEREIDHGTIPFETEGRLLEELGERLVASPEVALVELIKNAYDADSPTCDVTLNEAEESLSIADTGHGMTYEDFAAKWMRIATSSKIDHRVSPRFKRRLTGAKGIGRFAVRYLGGVLRLESVALDSVRRCKTRLEATFNWKSIDSARDLRRAAIPWRLVKVGDSAQTGTRLVIGSLKAAADFTREKHLRSEVLRIVSPLSGLDSGKFAVPQGVVDTDPGFSVTLPGESDSNRAQLNLAQTVLSHYWARLIVTLDGARVRYTVHFGASGRKKHFSARLSPLISAGIHADIRFFPRRKGVFAKKEVNGPEAWLWVKDNTGVAVIDHGFRIKPYGYPYDDWLRLDFDSVQSRRNWRSEIALKHFPIPEDRKKRPSLNPMLYLPKNSQLVGGVFVESLPASVSKKETDLVPSMDREGFLQNAGAHQLFEIMRGAMEFLAVCDKEEVETIKAEEAKATAAETRQDFRRAIEFFQNSPTLAPEDKARVIAEYADLAKRFETQEQYHKDAQHSLAAMSLLGVVAGFMTHESRAMVARLEETVHLLTELATKHPELQSAVVEITESLSRLTDHLDYTSLFIDATQHKQRGSFNVAPQIEMIIERFGKVAKERGVQIRSCVPESLKTPPLPVAAYSGILLNLFTNALKAVIAAPASNRHPTVQFAAKNENGRHVVDIADNGVGIPPEIRERIWDPLFTTTSTLNNPLGSGMGLGLSLVARMVRDLQGQITLLDEAPQGFTTCFRLTFPMPA